MDEWEHVYAVAERQHYVVATWQMMLLGISKKAAADRVRRHAWTRKHRGALALPGADLPVRELAAAVLAYSRPVGAAARVARLRAQGCDLVEAVVRAALECGQVVCGPSALWLHGIEPWSDKVWLRLPRGVGNATRGAINIRHGAPTGDTQWIEGLPVVDVEQSFLDLPGCLPDLTQVQLHHRLTKSLATGDARRKTTLDRVGVRLGEAGRFVGSVALANAVASLRNQLSHSKTEEVARSIVSAVLGRHGLLLHPRPYLVEHGGRRVGEADLAVVEITLDLEVDGPHHLLPAQQQKDQIRDRAMRRAGWAVERFPTELVDTSPKVFAARVDEVVRHRLATVAGSPVTVGFP